MAGADTFVEMDNSALCTVSTIGAA